MYIAWSLPPIPLILGSTTASVNADATAASNAFPPTEKINLPASDAYGCGEETTLLLYIDFSLLQLNITEIISAKKSLLIFELN